MAGYEALTEVASHVFLVDVRLFGRWELGGVYILAGREVAIVESGTSLAAPLILSALSELKIPKERVRWLFLTHIHLDHAGGAGSLVKELPNAVVVVHARGAKHLANPEKLVASVREAVGDRFQLYGEAIPIPKERLHVPEEGEPFPVGPHLIRALASPGHAPHHLCFWEENQGLLFTGDAAGLYLSRQLLPATPPPSFDLEMALASLEKLRALNPTALLYTHYGPRQGGEGLREYEQLLPAWIETISQALSAGAAASEQELIGFLASHGWPASDPRFRDDLLLSARGALLYLKRRAERA